MEESEKIVSENAVKKTKSVDVETLLEEKLKNSSGTKSIEDLGKEEKVLKSYLEKIKKECFLFQVQIKAWKDALDNKLARFKEIELDLDGVRQEIWTERDSFCTKADEIDDKFGVLSNWWKSQIDFVCDLENFRKRKIEENTRKEEIEVLMSEVENLEAEIEAMRKKQEIAKVEVHSSGDGEPNTERSKENLSRVVKHPEGSTDKNKTGNAEDEIVEVPPEYVPENFLYSMMNVNRVRDAQKKQKRRKEREDKKLIKREIERENKLFNLP